MCMISNGGLLFIICGHCYHGFLVVNSFGPALHFVVASAAYMDEHLGMLYCTVLLVDIISVLIVVKG